MTRILFDTNIYTLLSELSEQETLRTIAALCAEGVLSVLISNTIRRELMEGPRAKILKSIPFTIVGDSVFLCDYSQIGVDRLGRGQIYKSHMGDSTKFKDALVADIADFEADVFVTEDKRCLKRFKEAQISNRCQAFRYDEFKEWLCVFYKGRHDGRPLQHGG